MLAFARRLRSMGASAAAAVDVGGGGGVNKQKQLVQVAAEVQAAYGEWLGYSFKR